MIRHTADLTRLTAALVIAALFAPVTSVADTPQQDLPLPDAYKSLIVSAGAITTSSAELLQLERATKQLEAIRKTLSLKLIVHNSGDTFSLGIEADAPSQQKLQKSLADKNETLPDLSEKTMLCTIRSNHIRTVAQYNFLNSAVNKIQELSKPSNATDLASALKALLASYSVNAADASLLSHDGIATLQKRSDARCGNDIVAFDVAYYGTKVEEKLSSAPSAAVPLEAAPILSVFGPIGTLIDTVLGIVSPVIVELSNLVDEVKREAAIKKFLSDSDNQSALKSSGHALAQAVSDYSLAKRQKLAGSFVELMQVVRTTPINLSKIDACHDLSRKFERAAPNGPPSSAFMSCWRAVWNEIEPIVTSTLKVSSDYDQLADAGDTATALKAYDTITQDLNAIRDNAVTNPNLFWSYVTQLVSFANTVNTAFSSDNRDKLHKAIEALTKSP